VASDHTILVLGDSLSAALGIRPEQGWVALLGQRLQAQGYGYQIVNASVSGETTSGGLERLPRALQLHQPGTVILELGANDGLRGLPVDQTRENLAHMVRLSQAAGARVLLVGMRIPPNYGPRYTEQFARMFPELANEYHLPLVPFPAGEGGPRPNSHATGRHAPQRPGRATGSRDTLAVPEATPQEESSKRGTLMDRILAEVVSAPRARGSRPHAAALAEAAAGGNLCRARRARSPSSRWVRSSPTGSSTCSRVPSPHGLQQQGFRKGDRLAIMLPNTLQYPIAMFGALRAGLNRGNTNPLYTAPELLHQLSDSGATVILVLENFAHVLQKVLAGTQVKRVLVTAVGDFLGFPKSLIVNYVVRHLRRQVPRWNIPGASSFKRR